LSALTVLYPENRPALFMLILSNMILSLWVYANYPALAAVSGFYSIALLLVLVVFMAKSVDPEAPSEFIGLGDPGQAWFNIGLGAVVGVIFAIGVAGFAVLPPFAVVEPVALLFVIVLVPFVEELFFGSLLTPIFCRFFTVPFGLGIVGATFAFYHYRVWGATLQAVIILFMLRVLFSGLIIWRRSVAPAIVAHTIINLIIYTTTQLQEVTVAAVASACLLPMLNVKAMKGKRELHKFGNPVGLNEVIGAVYGLWAVIGAGVAYHWFNLFMQGIDPVETLGMVIPRNLFLVLLPCHLVLIPWLLLNAYGVFYLREWFPPSIYWMTLLAGLLSIIENMFRTPQTPVVLCICLFTALTSIIAAPLLWRLAKEVA